MPSAPSWSASSSMRVIASSRAEYIASDRTVISSLVFHEDCWKPMWKIDEPTTRPSGSKPASLTSRNSATDRSDVNRPRLFCSRRARPAAGTPSIDVGS